MPKFTDCLNSSEARANWAYLMLEFGVKPAEVNGIRQRPVEVDAKIEPDEEIAKIMSTAPGFLKYEDNEDVLIEQIPIIDTAGRKI